MRPRKDSCQPFFCLFCFVFVSIFVVNDVGVGVGVKGYDENGDAGPRSVVVSASDCGSQGLGFESHQSHVGFYFLSFMICSCPKLEVLWAIIGMRLGPYSRASATSEMRL